MSHLKNRSQRHAGCDCISRGMMPCSSLAAPEWRSERKAGKADLPHEVTQGGILVASRSRAARKTGKAGLGGASQDRPSCRFSSPLDVLDLD